MDKTLRILQLNVGKQDVVQHSLLNDEAIKDFGFLAILEPHSWKDGDTLIVAPMGHYNWTKFTPTVQHTGRWAIRSMLWVCKDLEVVQLAVESPDITAALLSLPERAILVASVYIPPQDNAALQKALELLRQLIEDAR